MTIHTVQKLIKIGSSKGVTIPARDLHYAGVEVGDDVEITVKKVTKPEPSVDDQEIFAIAKKILKDYKEDFVNLAKR